MRKKKYIEFEKEAQDFISEFALDVLYDVEKEAKMRNSIIAMCDIIKSETVEETKQDVLYDDDFLEPSSTFYALDKFKECTTLEDFKQAYKEIEIRSYNFYKPLGLKDKKGKQIII